jgi:photosystem II stability/assembly factor-like uncharacterized protein
LHLFFVRAWCASLVALVIAGSAVAGPNRWTSTGPETGYANGLAVDPKTPNIIYAGSPGGGIFKSWDGGQRWFRINRGLEGNSAIVNEFAFDPADSNIVYAGMNSGVHKSTDGGAHWTRLIGYTSTMLAVDPKNPSVIYSGFGSALYKSTNGGANWTQLTTETTVMLDLVVDRESPSTLYYGSADPAKGGVYKSTDGGATWTNVGGGIPTKSIYSLAIDPKNPAKLWAGTQGNGVWLSTDRGATWTKKSGGASGLPDAGNWQAAAVSPVGNTVYFGANGGMYATNSDGAAWFHISPETESYTVSIEPDPVSPSTVYISTDRSMQKSTNGGNGWTRIMNGFSAYEPDGVDVHPVEADTAFTWGSDGLFRTTNGGDSWSRLGDRVYVNGLAVDPQNPAVMYVQHQGMYSKSTDGGATWTAFTKAGVPSGNVETLVHDPVKPATLYAGYTDQGLWTNVNGGTWTPLNNGFSANARVSQISFDASSPSTMYIATSVGIFKSGSSGSSWTPMNNGLKSTNATAIVCLKNSPSTLYAIAASRLYKSTDGAVTWNDITPATVSNIYTVVATNSGSDVFIGNNLNAWRSRDGGATWTPFGAGFDFGYTRTLAINAANTRLYAGSYRAGVFTLRLSPVILPVAASVHGNGGAFFHSDVMLVNPSASAAMNLQATYRCYSGVCGTATKTITIEPRQAVAYSDVVTGLFGAPETGGPIEFDAPAHLIVTSRLYTPSKPSPTFGQFVPGVTADAATTRGILPLLSNGTNGGGFRSNIGLYNPGDAQETITVTLYSDAGAVFGSTTRTLAAKSGTQINNIFDASGASSATGSAFAIVTSAKPVISYASVLDNQSQDPIFVLAQDGVQGMSGTVTVPAAASLHGQNGAFFHSDVAIVNVSTTEAANVTAYYRCSSGNCGTSPKSFTIAAGQQLTQQDIVVSLFGASESGGAIEFVTSGRIAVASRLYTPSKPAPTFGQYVPGLPLSRAAGRLIVPSLSNSASSANGFRSNVGVFNASDVAHDVTFFVHAIDGSLLGSTTRNVAARQLVQVNNIFNAVGVAQDVEAAYCVIEGAGAVPLFGFASVLDNQSQDPIFVVGEAGGK